MRYEKAYLRRLNPGMLLVSVGDVDHENMASTFMPVRLAPGDHGPEYNMYVEDFNGMGTYYLRNNVHGEDEDFITGFAVPIPENENEARQMLRILISNLMDPDGFVELTTAYADACYPREGSPVNRSLLAGYRRVEQVWMWFRDNPHREIKPSLCWIGEPMPVQVDDDLTHIKRVDSEMRRGLGEWERLGDTPLTISSIACEVVRPLWLDGSPKPDVLRNDTIVYVYKARHSAVGTICTMGELRAHRRMSQVGNRALPLSRDALEVLPASTRIVAGRGLPCMCLGEVLTVKKLCTDTGPNYVSCDYGIHLLDGHARNLYAFPSFLTEDSNAKQLYTLRVRYTDRPKTDGESREYAFAVFDVGDATSKLAQDGGSIESCELHFGEMDSSSLPLDK